jgi:hypothetical protein
MDEHTFAIAFIRTMGAVLAVVAWQVLAAARERSRQHPDTEAAVLELAQRVEEVERLEAPSGRCSRGDALGNIHPPTTYGPPKKPRLQEGPCHAQARQSWRAFACRPRGLWKTSV